jgi:hypothetical protein
MKRSTTKLLVATIFSAMAVQSAYCFSLNPFRKKVEPTITEKVMKLGKTAVNKSIEYGAKGFELAKNNPKTATAIALALTGTAALAKTEKAKKVWKDHKGKIIAGTLITGLAGGYIYAPAAYLGLATSGAASLVTYAPKILNSFNTAVGTLKNISYLFGGRGNIKEPEDLNKEIIAKSQKPAVEKKQAPKAKVKVNRKSKVNRNREMSARHFKAYQKKFGGGAKKGQRTNRRRNNSQGCLKCKGNRCPLPKKK